MCWSDPLESPPKIIWKSQAPCLRQLSPDYCYPGALSWLLPSATPPAPRLECVSLRVSWSGLSPCPRSPKNHPPLRRLPRSRSPKIGRSPTRSAARTVLATGNLANIFTTASQQRRNYYRRNFMKTCEVKMAAPTCTTSNFIEIDVLQQITRDRTASQSLCIGQERFPLPEKIVRKSSFSVLHFSMLFFFPRAGHSRCAATLLFGRQKVH